MVFLGPLAPKDPKYSNTRACAASMLGIAISEWVDKLYWTLRVWGSAHTAIPPFGIVQVYVIELFRQGRLNGEFPKSEAAV